MLRYGRVGSTNDEARAQVVAGRCEPFVVRADVQTGGRGRTGRSWASPIGGVWATFAFPMRRAPSAYQPAPLVAGLAVAAAVDRFLGRSAGPGGVWGAVRPTAGTARLKWPNDVLVGGRKIAGVLGESLLPRSSGSARGFLLLGIGINADVDVSVISGAMVERTAESGVDDAVPTIEPTSLRAECGGGVSADEVFDQLLLELSVRLAMLERVGSSRVLRGALAGSSEPDAEGSLSGSLSGSMSGSSSGISALGGSMPMALADELSARLAFVGEPLTLHDGQRLRSGLCRGVDGFGRLLLESADGTVDAYVSGEVSSVRAWNLG